VEIGRGVAGGGEEDVEVGKEVAGVENAVAAKKKKSDKKIPGELAETSPGGGGRKELPSNAENGTVLFNPYLPPCQLNTAAGTHFNKPPFNRDRQQSDGSINTASTFYDIHGNLNRNLSIDTTMTGSATNRGMTMPELDTSQPQSPN
jgi:hypothetical protein